MTVGLPSVEEAVELPVIAQLEAMNWKHSPIRTPSIC